ncbi:ferritin-like domain-containing protein [Mycena filopes]|nr:ferritin-like domain-containing protein [Mycena filopes]
MKYSITIAFLALSKIAHALPTIRHSTRDVPSGTHSALSIWRSVSHPLQVSQILNFALLAEHLELAFYQQALRRFSQSDFAAAGFSDWARDRFQQISDHEDTHATFLSSALTTSGAKAVAPCEYNFGFTDVQSFVDFSATLEAAGTAAYIGAAQFGDDKDYVTIAGSILAVEARHAVYTVLAPLVKSCPASNADALTAYPTLTVNNGHLGALFVAFVSSIARPMFVPLHDNKAVVPADLAGFVFCLITTDGGLTDDSTAVAGPTILNFPYSSSATFEF